MKMQLDVSKIADVSTRYVTKEDSDLMIASAPGHVASVDGKTGDIFYVVISDEDIHTKLRNNMIRFGFSDAFVAIIDSAYAQGISYVRFDSDGGDIIGDAEEFKW